MATPQGPPTGGAAPMVPSINTQEIGFHVRNWVHYDNLATSLYRQTVNARKVRDEFETKIVDTLRSAQMEKAIIQIAGGRLTLQEERHNQPLTLTRIEEILHTYFVSKNMPDDTPDIMKFIKKQREFKVASKLRKQSGPLPSALPPLAPAQG